MVHITRGLGCTRIPGFSSWAFPGRDEDLVTLFLFRVLLKQHHQQQQKVKQTKKIKIYKGIDIWHVYQAQIS